MPDPGLIPERGCPGGETDRELRANLNQVGCGENKKGGAIILDTCRRVSNSRKSVRAPGEHLLE